MTLLFGHIEAFLLSQETEVQEMAALHEASCPWSSEASHGRESIEGLEKFISADLPAVCSPLSEQGTLSGGIVSLSLSIHWAARP